MEWLEPEKLLAVGIYNELMAQAHFAKDPKQDSIRTSNG
jgi:hypothetical protein